jgi:hypothetical protein
MEHSESLATKASERYLLGEMDEPERFAFENHYFNCEICGDDVRSGVVLARGIRAVFAAGELAPLRDNVPERSWRDWFAWLTPPVLAPSAAALVLAVVAGYQSFVMIPSLREGSTAQALEPWVINSAERGEEKAYHVKTKTGRTVLEMDVSRVDPGTKVTWELHPPGGRPPVSGTTELPRSRQLNIDTPNSLLYPHPGPWTLTLHMPERVDTYSFVVDNQ